MVIKAILVHKNARKREEQQKDKVQDEAFGGGKNSSHKNDVQDTDETEQE